MPKKKGSIALPLEPEEILKDYRLAYQSRQVSLIGRREVLSGKAKFGIFGDGKELANIAIARAFRKGDWRSGYYRDQTWVNALGVLDYQAFFAQLYAHADIKAEPATGAPRADRKRPSSCVRARGHRLEGIWHSGSPMARIINLVRGMYVLFPRATGFYNTLLKSDEPAIVVEVLNGYRVKERLSFIFDYRILDGASADWFLAKVKETLENWA
jgi:hypothetical protein